MKIALINDMLVQEGGQERVLRALQELYPESPTFVLIYDEQKKAQYYRQSDLRASFLQHMPGIKTKYQWYLPLMPMAIESHDLKDFDIVISSSSSFAKGVITKPDTCHVCYCHTPTRYLWSDFKGYVEDLPYPGVVKKFLPFYLSFLRNWDWSAAQRVDYFLSNSKNVQSRVKKYYQKDSTIIYPPVEVEKFSIANQIKDYYLIGGRLVPYKRYDVAIRAFNKLDLPLKVFGTGPEMDELRGMAKNNIKFLGEVTDDQKMQLYNEAIAFINPQEEDFGITAVEAMAAGRPVIAYEAGGALETVEPNLSGEFFEDQTWESLANTIIHFKPEKYDAQKIRAHAMNFSKENFQRQMIEFVDKIKNKK